MRVWEQFQICSCLVSPQPGCSLQRNANVPRNECSLLVDKSEISRVFWSFGRFAPLYKSGTASLNAEVNERFVKIEAPGVARSIPPDTSISDPRVLQLSRNFKRPKAPSRLYWGRNSKVCLKIRKLLLKFHKNCWYWNNCLLKCWVWSGAKVCTSCRSWKMLSNAYFLANLVFNTAENEPAKNLQNSGKIQKCRQTHISLQNFVFDTAENEPAKNLQKFANFANFADPNPLTP